ncbi:MAG: ribonuclease HII [Verrucomicrobiales bacterium]
MPDFSYESLHWAAGKDSIAGVDEAGRGPLAGPVVAGAAILARDFAHPWVNDSKKLSEKRREALFEELAEDERVSWAIGIAGVAEIDELNILGATRVAMARAVAGLGATVDFCLVDGLPLRDFPHPHEGVVKGDGKSLSIAVASIFAKVTRDRIMRDCAREFPHYGFEKHKGYGTKAHLEALRSQGPCRLHRRSFQPVAQLALPLGE